jgi:Periplasmic binding protein/Cytochrome c
MRTTRVRGSIRRRPVHLAVRLAVLAGIGVLIAAPGVLLAADADVPSAADPDVLTAAEARGRALFRSGKSPRGSEIVAVLSDGAVELPGSSLPCAGCHGRDGRGGREGGVAPSDLTWQSLSKPYGSHQPGGRSHPPYTERLLGRAIALGTDPAGNPLHGAMPRYRMSREDMADLVAYLRRLGSEPVSGLSGDIVRIGTLLPPGAAGEAVGKLLEACFAEVNARGGVFGRRLELRPIALTALSGAAGDGDTAGQRRARLAALLEREPVFALAGAFLGGAERELAGLFRELELPVVGAVGAGPVPGEADSPWVFHLLSGLEGQGRALVRFAARDLAPTPPAPPTPPAGTASPKLAVLARDEPVLLALADAVEAEVASLGGLRSERFRYPPGGLDAAALARTLRDSGADLLFLAVPGADQGALLAAAAALGWHPRVLAPGSLAGAGPLAAPPGFSRRIFLAFPTLPEQISPTALADYQRLAVAAGLPRRDLPAQLSALAAARLLVAALERTGRDLTRDALIAQLEKFDRFETGFLPALTYGPGRRIGAHGAYVVTVDLDTQALTPASGWIGVE